MMRPRTLGLVLLLISGFRVTAADNGGDIAGVYQGKSGAGDFVETWQIRLVDGAITVVGTFHKGNQAAGLFQGKNVKYADGTLTFEQSYVKKPEASWSDGTEISATLSGKKLEFTWKNGAQTGKNTLERIPSADDFIGTWEGASTRGGFKEIWQVRIEKNAVVVLGKFQKDGEDVGSFKGTGVKFASGALSFTQKYQKKPDAGWSDGNQITARLRDDKLNFTWKGGGKSGDGTLERAKP